MNGIYAYEYIRFKPYSVGIHAVCQVIASNGAPLESSLALNLAGDLAPHRASDRWEDQIGLPIRTSAYARATPYPPQLAIPPGRARDLPAWPMSKDALDHPAPVEHDGTNHPGCVQA